MTTSAIIGFGEVGGIFARDLHAAGAAGIAADDIDETARTHAGACGFHSSIFELDGPIAAIGQAVLTVFGAEAVAKSTGDIPERLAFSGRSLAQGRLQFGEELLDQALIGRGGRPVEHTRARRHGTS